MPAQFFLDTDAPGAKTIGTDNAYQNLMTFMRVNKIPWSPAILDRDDIHDAIGDVWDGIDVVAIRADIVGNLNGQASDLEVALITQFVLMQKFSQYSATLPGGG